MLLVLLLLLALGSTQQCTIYDNTDFDNGYLVMLFNISSPQACCTSCSTFEECTYFSYIKAPNAGEWYRRCFIKTSGTGRKVSNANAAGPINRNPPPPPPTCSGTDGVDYGNGWITLLENVPDASTCCNQCRYFPGCVAWTYLNDPKAGAWYKRCFFHSSTTNRTSNAGTISGTNQGPIRPPSPRSGKRGIAWFNTNSCSDLKLFTGISWFYNWAPTPDQAIFNCFQQLGIEFIPMQWGGGGLADLNFTIFGDSKHLLTFNEPNFHSQSNVLPAAAAGMWPKIEAIAKQRGMLISSPAAAACGPNPETECYAGSWNPEPWFDAFFGNCTNCKVDFLTTHIYTCDINQLKSFITGLYKYNKPIWLTEFACPAAGQPVQNEINFMKEALAFLDSQKQVARYAWFGTRLDPGDGWLGPQVDLLSQTGSSLTDLGKLYNS